MPVRGSGGLVSSWSLLIRGILAALRQKLHLSTCPNLASHLFYPAKHGPKLLRREGIQILHHALGPMGDGWDPERPSRDQALTAVDADGPANGRIIRHAPLISRSATPTRIRQQNLNSVDVPEPSTS